MTHPFVKAGVFALALWWPSAQAAGQPSFSATYDNAKHVKMQGIVTKVAWVNPHAFVFINVKDTAGAVVNWAVEVGNPIELEHDGWKPTAVAPGDMLLIEGALSRAGTKQIFATSVMAGATRARLFAASGKRPSAASAPSSQSTPRWPDGQVRLGPLPGQKGYWGRASANALVQATAAKVAMNADGLLLNIADAARVAPFKPWAKAVYEYRQRTRLKDDPAARCLPPGGPRQFLTHNGFQFVEQRELGRILVLLGGGDRNWRVIYTDGRPAGQAAEAVLSYYGTSVGQWEQDTLVVDSVGFNEKFWMTNGGLPHTEALHLTERFSRPNFSTLRYEVTIDEPRTYTRPWTGSWTIQWIADREIQEYFCEENVESALLRQ